MARLAAAVLAAAALGLAPQDARASLDTGIVDVTTNLAYRGGAAAGTGMVLARSGIVLTNNHVIRGATTIRVVDPSSGRTYPAKVVGYSVAGDVAVLRVTGARGLRTVRPGSSAKVAVGQTVTAAGNAGGAGGRPSHARGKVTAVGATITATDDQGHTERLTGLIKTNAALEPGDSGGPLLDAAGRVIGMNTAGSSRFYFEAAREGYAIPIDRALALVRQITAGRGSDTVHIGSTPFLGVALDGGTGRGVLVSSVISGTPAERAGLVAGDTITALDGHAVASYDRLSTVLLRHHAGDSVRLDWRDASGSRRHAVVVTAAGPPQ